MSEKRVIADRKGREAETQAAQFLMQKGFEIVGERRKTKLGEIDLIARRPGLVVFAEVKWRARKADLATAIDEHRLARVAAAVEVVAHEYAQGNEDIRIDVILLAPGSRPTHIKNAWMP
ncbi:YraN family protein [uncultured Erythrobacter sp.]|uniref:YraN family protein n=1 Tax=uncultured Erythrobacter sp. TaxID=263913 RepID=UPI00260E4704|nr:YraN family protein [uncultured Erythrobacter sp.]